MVRKCKHLAQKHKQWLFSLTLTEKAFPKKCEAASGKFLSEGKRAEWHLNTLKRHRPIKEAKANDPDQKKNKKADHSLQESQRSST